MSEERIYEINQTLKAQEDAFFNKWLKVKETKGLNSQTGTAIGQKRTPSQGAASRRGDETSTSQLPPGATPKVRKTKEQRLLKDLEAADKKVDGLSAVEGTVEEAKRIKIMQVKGNEFDIQIVSAKTVENLLKFLGLVPHSPHLYDLDRNIN
jgi:transposase